MSIRTDIVSPPKFEIGSMVQWAEDAPAEWRFIYTPNQMKVELIHYIDGIPSEYAKKFNPEGFSFQQGFLYEVTYDVSASTYYDPPLKSYIGKGRSLIHEKWLREDGWQCSHCGAKYAAKVCQKCYKNIVHHVCESKKKLVGVCCCKGGLMGLINN